MAPIVRWFEFMETSLSHRQSAEVPGKTRNSAKIIVAPNGSRYEWRGTAESLASTASRFLRSSTTQTHIGSRNTATAKLSMKVTLLALRLSELLCGPVEANELLCVVAHFCVCLTFPVPRPVRSSEFHNLTVVCLRRRAIELIAIARHREYSRALLLFRAEVGI